MSLTIQDFADYELLQTIDKEPKSTTAELAGTLNREKRDVASRLAWMKRMNLIERTIALSWVLAPRGKEVVNGRASDVLQLRQITTKAKRSPSIAWVMKREARRNL